MATKKPDRSKPVSLPKGLKMVLEGEGRFRVGRKNGKVYLIIECREFLQGEPEKRG